MRLSIKNIVYVTMIQSSINSSRVVPCLQHTPKPIRLVTRHCIGRTFVTAFQSNFTSTAFFFYNSMTECIRLPFNMFEKLQETTSTGNFSERKTPSFLFEIAGIQDRLLITENRDSLRHSMNLSESRRQ